MRKNLAYYPDGVVDTCIIVVALFKNPLYTEAIDFLAKVLDGLFNSFSTFLLFLHVVKAYIAEPRELCSWWFET
jgi:hypothetical protein